MLKTPIIIVNYKTYQEGYGRNAIELTQAIQDVAKEKGISAAVAVSPTDIGRLAGTFEIPVLAQHMDDVGFGSNTGYILPEAVKEAGAKGTLINHSEHRLKIADIDALVSRCKSLEMASVVCTNNIKISGACAALGPDFVAVEPPGLIGGDISVSTAQPEVVSGSVDAVRKTNPGVKVLCGAGVKNGEDVRKAVELGTDGVLLASGIVKAKDVRAVMSDLADGLL